MMTRMTGALSLSLLAALAVSSYQVSAAGQRPAPAPAAASATPRAIVDKYCVTCHNPRAKAGAGGLALDGVDLNDFTGNAAVLEKVVKKLELGAMPPKGLPRPDPATYQSLTSSLSSGLDRAAAARLRPGRSEPLHRLNRVEYRNAVRDLLGVEGVDVSMMLPADDASYGFDNVAGILGMSPTHLEKYLSAARKISQLAVGDVGVLPLSETHLLPVELSQDDRFDELPFGTRGGTLIRRLFPVDADYVIRFRSFPAVGTAFKEPNFLEVTVDGERVFFKEVEQRRSPIGGSDDFEGHSDYEIRVPIKGGVRDVGVTYVKTTSAQLESFLQPYLRPPGVSTFAHGRLGGYAGPAISYVTFLGPFNATGSGELASRRRVFTCYPARPAEELPCAEKILSALAQKAYRRPVDDEDVLQVTRRLLAFYKKGSADGGFEKGIQAGLERLLASPGFLFRTYREPAKVAAGTAYRLDDFELASRLSFFLWSSIPDDELLSVARRGKLREPAVLEQQARRMLADPRSVALAENFAGQWLRLRNLQGLSRDTRQFPDFDDNFRQAARRETELFFDSIIREDRSALDLLGANHTFLNERMARHYGIPNVYGSHFRRVTLEDPHRRGLLGQASVLAVTSQSDRTSVVGRGKWILENILGAPPPPPPPDVPPLEATELQGTLRQRMEQHRKNPVCASCHKTMDPLGFALENFDAIGAWRTRDAGMPVDSEGSLPDGTTFQGIDGLRTALLKTPDVFVSTLTERLLTYALGRGVEYYDAPAIRTIVRDAARNDYRFSAIVLGVLKSVPFQMREAETVAAPPAASVARR